MLVGFGQALCSPPRLQANNPDQSRTCTSCRCRHANEPDPFTNGFQRCQIAAGKSCYILPSMLPGKTAGFPSTYPTTHFLPRKLLWCRLCRAAALERNGRGELKQMTTGCVGAGAKTLAPLSCHSLPKRRLHKGGHTLSGLLRAP